MNKESNGADVFASAPFDVREERREKREGRREKVAFLPRFALWSKSESDFKKGKTKPFREGFGW